MEEEKYEYTTVDYIKDGVATVCMATTLFIMIWIAFALDVTTTGM